MGPYADQHMPVGNAKGKTDWAQISSGDCKNACINEPACVAISYTKWGNCTTWTDISQGLKSDCCSGTSKLITT